MIAKVLMIGVLGGLGSLMRFGLGTLIRSFFPGPFPHATVLINVLGSFAIGIVSMAPLGDELRTALMVGFLGGFTTFSAFSLESVQLVQSGLTGSAALYIVTSVFCCLSACWLGQVLLR